MVGMELLALVVVLSYVDHKKDAWQVPLSRALTVGGAGRNHQHITGIPALKLSSYTDWKQYTLGVTTFQPDGYVG